VAGQGPAEAGRYAPAEAGQRDGPAEAGHYVRSKGGGSSTSLPSTFAATPLRWTSFAWLPSVAHAMNGRR